MELKELFTEYFKTNRWGMKETVSGRGSTIKWTGRVRDWIPVILEKYRIRSILDAGCGDFNWMRLIDLSGVNYYGCDIVDEIVENNIQKYAQDGRTFFVTDITTDEDLLKVDLIICRTVLFHLTVEHARQALSNFCKSGSKYLMVTTHGSPVKNIDARVEGKWRKLNLQLPPFNLPEPLESVNDSVVGEDGKLAFWRLSDINRLFRALSITKKGH